MSYYLPYSFLLLNTFCVCGMRMRMFTCRVSNFIMMSKSTWHGVQKCVIGVQCISNVSPFCWTFTRYCTNSENVGQRGFLGVNLFLGPLTWNFKSETGLCLNFSQCIWKAPLLTFVLMVQWFCSKWRSLIRYHNNYMMQNRLKNSSF